MIIVNIDIPKGCALCPLRYECEPYHLHDCVPLLENDCLIKGEVYKKLELKGSCEDGTKPPVTPQPKMRLCKDCKWWKDSDGVYRRGIGAESQCPINHKEVYEGNGYCFMYEPNMEIVK